MHFGFAAVAPLCVSAKLYAALCGTRGDRFTCCLVQRNIGSSKLVKQRARECTTCPHQSEQRAVDVEISLRSRGPHARQALHGSLRATVGGKRP